MARTYSEDSYASKKMLHLRETGALNGTQAAATTVGRTTFMMPVTVTDANLEFVAGGTSTVTSIILGKSAAGTGAVTAIGTIAIGTQAIDTVKDGAVTSTSFSAGDDLVVQRAAGTSTTVENVVPVILYVENYEQADS